MTIETPDPRVAAHSSTGTGRIEAIHLAAIGGGPMRPVDRVRAVAGVGLDGDRYAAGTGTWSPEPRSDRQLTLIEAEEIEALAARDGIVLEPGETRRNVTTRGIRLNDLVGRRFRVGAIECEAIRLCEPCQGLTDRIGKPILKPLAHRAGLRAVILTDGEIAVGDEVVALD
ncbi:MAG TPA: MOSC domain-containing protein [Verrucomicrobiae bacterium]|nr:MOSC domain-containing protein [Verrucomicrobiae bacterium]